MAFVTHRVALVCEACGGGLGRHVLDLAEDVSALGHSVVLIYSPTRLGHGFEERLARRREFGYEAVPVAMERAPGLSDVGVLAKVRRVVRQSGPLDVLHGHSSKGGALARLARWDVTKGVVYTPNAWYTLNPQLSGPVHALYGAVERFLARLTDRIIVTSIEEREHALSIGIDAQKLVEIPNGMDLWSWSEVRAARQRTRAALKISADAPVVGFVGRLVPQKAPDLAVRVMAHVKKLRPDIAFVMAGRGPEYERTRALADSLGVEDDIRWVPDAVGVEVIPAFDVFLMTSLYEGFPYTLLEALNSGCAIVTTRVGGASACVREGANGFITKDASVDTLAKALVRAIEMRGQRSAVEEVSRELAQRYSRSEMTRRTVEVYGSIVP